MKQKLNKRKRETMANTKTDTIIAGVSATIQTFCGVVQTTEVFQLISVIIGILTGLVTLAYFIWRWWTKAFEDKKITKEEVNELLQGINDIVNKKEDDE